MIFAVVCDGIVRNVPSNGVERDSNLLRNEVDVMASIEANISKSARVECGDSHFPAI